MLAQLKNPELLKTCSYINGQWLSGENTFNVFNPFNQAHICTCDEVTSKQVDLAIESAHKSLDEWQYKNAAERAQFLVKWADLIKANIEDLAYILTLEQGKPLPEAVGEINYGLSYLTWFSEEAKRIDGDIIAAPANDKQILVQKNAVGVVAAITPWNFPNAMLLRKAAAALAAGCTFVAKPSEETPLSALALAYLADQAGIPKGVFNVLVTTDAPSIGDKFTNHPYIAKLTFTGSTVVGQKLAQQASRSVKRLSLELGGNAPFIIFDDAELDQAIAGLIASKFRNSGQTCISANRIFIHKDIYETCLAKLTETVKTFTFDNGLNSPTLSAMINEKAIKKAHALVESATKQGAKIHYQAQNPASSYPVTIMTDVSNEMEIAQTELFAPILTLIPFESEASVIQQANDTPYGLAAYFYSQNLKRVWRVSKQLKFGMVGINEGAISNAISPFGGVKQSGYGREGSKYGLDDYLETKYLALGNL